MTMAKGARRREQAVGSGAEGRPAPVRTRHHHHAGTPVSRALASGQAVRAARNACDDVHVSVRRPYSFACVAAFVVACLSFGHASAAHAQVAGVPVFHSLKHDPRWSIHADYGNGGRDLDGLAFAGVRISNTPGAESAAGVLRISVLAGRVLRDAGETTNAGALTVALALAQRRLIQFEPQAGIGWTDGGEGGVSRIDIPLGVAIGIPAALPPFGFTGYVSRNPQVWIAPRAQLRATDVPVLGRRVRGGLGGSIGLELRSQPGLGVQIVHEWLVIRDAALPRWRTETAFGLSMFFAWI